MVRKAIVCLLLALAMTVLLQPQVLGALRTAAMDAMHAQEATPSQALPQPPSFTEQLGGAAVSDTLDVTLYYRCGDTGLLGARHAQLDIRREETIATSIVQRLLDGPDGDVLEGVFPRGTRLVSVTSEGATVFVTLSREFLGRPDGAPSDWEDSPQWQREAAHRRMLAMQSLVLSLTEDGRCQRVQLYLADSDDDVPMRVPLAYFDPGVEDPGVVLAACSRDESDLLTPQRALDMLLDAWQRRDWETVYTLLEMNEDERHMELAEFENEMSGLDVSLLEYETSSGSVSFDGQRATLVLSAHIRSVDGGDALLVRESVPMRREEDIWRISLKTLMSLMVRD